MIWVTATLTRIFRFFALGFAGWIDRKNLTTRKR